MSRKILNEIKRFFSWWTFFAEAERKRQEWYHQEIVQSLEDKDFDRASFLLMERAREYNIGRLL